MRLSSPNKTTPLTNDDLITIILDEAFHVHKTIGPGLLENVYKTCLAYRLKKRNLYVETEKPVAVIFEDVKMDCGYRADIVVENLIVIETKAIETINPIDIAQTLTCLRFLQLRNGLLLNFQTTLLKNGIRRVVNGY